MRNKGIERAVSHCAALFDSKVPDWDQKIDRATLDVRVYKGHPLVQLFGRVQDGIIALGIEKDRTALEALFPKSDHQAREANRAWQHAVAVREIADVA